MLHMIQDSIIVLSAKLCTAMTGAVASFMATPVFALIDNAPPWLAEYGAIGMMCGFLVYALKVMHSINQNLQRDWREDRRKAEDERIADRDKFYGKLEEHFNDALSTREELVDACKKQSVAMDELVRTIKTMPPCKHQ